MQQDRTFNIEEWKATHSLDALVEQTTGAQVRRGRNLICPFHADSTPSLTVFDDGRWRCWGCDRRGDALDWLGYTWFGDDYNLRDVIDRLGEIAPRIPAPVRRKPELRPSLPPDIVEKFEARMGEREMHYWRRRGISPHAIYSLQIGWTGQRYAFPWFYRGLLTAIKFRRDDELCPELEPKYISAKGSRFAAPYNIDAVTMREVDYCLIVEDEKSVLAAARYHIPAISAPANQWREEWSAMLASVDQIVIVADADAPGRAAAAKIKSSLKRARVLEVPDGGGKDLFDYHAFLHKYIEEREAMEEQMRGWLGV